MAAVQARPLRASAAQYPWAAKPRMTGSLSEARWLPVSQLPLQGRTTGVTTQVIDTMDVAGTQPTTQHGGQHGEKRTDEGDP